MPGCVADELGRAGPAWQGRCIGSLLLTVALEVGAQPARGAGVAPASMQASASYTVPKPVGLVLNGVPGGRPTLAGTVDGDLVVLLDDLRQLGLMLPASSRALSIDGLAFIRLSDLPGLVGRLSDDEATLVLSATPAAFLPTRRSSGAEARTLPPSTILPLAFLGYDISLARHAGSLRASGLFDAGVSGNWGVAGTTALLQPAGHRLVRLQSSVQRDFPGKRLRLVLGDTFTRAGELNGSVRYGCIRIGTDFTLAPSEINSPLPVVSGSALVPSTVELLAATGRQSHSVGPGRFLIEAPATINGAGEVVMTIADATGTVRQVRQSIYSSSHLLRPGLTDYSLEGGALRRRYGDRSASYGEGFAAVSWRRGLTPALTAGARVEASLSTAMSGLTLNAVVGRLGEVALAGAVSRTAAGVGSLWRMQVQRLGRSGSFRASYLKTSAAFSQVGEDQASPRRRGRHQLSASTGLALPIGEVSIGMVDARLCDGSRYRLATLGYSATVRTLYLQASLRSARFDHGTDNGFFLSLSRPLGRRGSAALTADKGLLTTSYQWSAPDRRGVGFGMAATRGSPGSRLDSYAIVHAPLGDVEVTAASAGGGLDVRGSVRGALVFIENRLIPTARLHDGLALVEVASDGAVGILQEGRPVARRAKAGRPVLLTGLQPYAANRIAIRTEDLPLSVDLDDDEAVAVPGFRQAAAIRFGSANSSPPVTIAISDESGRILGPGLDVTLDGVRVGVTGHDGLIFLADGGGGRLLRVGTSGGQCEAVLPERLRLGSDGSGELIRCRRIVALETAR